MNRKYKHFEYLKQWLKAIDMDSAKRLHSVKRKKRELRGAQRASRQKIEEIRKVTKFFSLFFNTLHHTLF